jgi:hypothetical protein
MTKRRVVVGVLAGLLWAGVNDAAAQAGGWRGWLDRLSGPGEFAGVEVSAQIFCYGVPEATKAGASVADTPGSATAAHREWGGVDLACHGKVDRLREKGKPDVDLWRVAFGLEYARSTAADNPLEYGGGSQGDGPTVTLNELVSTVGFMPNAWLEVGAGAGIGWFTTAGFGTTAKALVQPVRVSVRPFTLLMAGRERRPPAAGILQLRFNLTSFPGGFDAADFGAVPGSWEADTELLKSFSIVLDFGVFLKSK